MTSNSSARTLPNPTTSGLSSEILPNEDGAVREDEFN